MKRFIALIAVLLIIAVGAGIYSAVRNIDKEEEIPASDSGETSTFGGLEGIVVGNETETTQRNETQTLPEEVTDETLTVPETKEEIVSFVSTAVNKTKEYKGSMTVNHSQKYEVDITDAPGGKPVQKIANAVAEGIAKPIDETLTFRNGVAKGSDGENLSMLLPLNKPFTLSYEGVENASVDVVNGNIVVTLTLKAEKSSINEAPTCHAGSVGYVDLTSVDFGPLQMTDFDVDYYCSVIKFTVNRDGYVINAVYDIPFNVDCTGEIFGVSADVKLEGRQYEVWTITG